MAARGARKPDVFASHAATAAFLVTMPRKNRMFAGSTAVYTGFMTAPLHERLSEIPRAAPTLLADRVVICSGCRHDTVHGLPIGCLGFCYVCLARSRSAAEDGELGGEC